MNEKEIKQKIDEEGFVRAIILFEVIGSPKETVERAINNHLKKIESDKNIIFIQKDVAEAEKQDNLWSTFAEVEMIVKGLELFTWICMNFMPASVEIMEPEELKFKARNLTGWLNDLLAKNHEISTLSQQIGQQNKLMLKNTNALIRNTILICVDSNINDPEKIASKIGVAKKDLDPVFEALIKEGRLKKEDNKFYRK